MVSNPIFSVTPQAYGDEWVRGFEAGIHGLSWDPPGDVRVARSWGDLLLKEAMEEGKTHEERRIALRWLEANEELGLAVCLFAPIEDAYFDGWMKGRGVEPDSVTNADKAGLSQEQARGWQKTPSLRFLLSAVQWPTIPPKTSVSALRRLTTFFMQAVRWRSPSILSQPAKPVAADFRCMLGYMLSADGMASTRPSVRPEPVPKPLPEDVDEQKALLQASQDTLRFAVAEMLPPACQKVTLTLTFTVGGFGKLNQSLDFHLRNPALDKKAPSSYSV